LQLSRPPLTPPPRSRWSGSRPARCGSPGGGARGGGSDGSGLRRVAPARDTLAVSHARRAQPAEEAPFEMANLRPQTTGLPFVVYISQRGNARHGPRVKVSPAPRVQLDQMASYAVSPLRHVAGPRLGAQEEARLGRWVALNAEVLIGYWDGSIPYTEDAIDRLKPV